MQGHHRSRYSVFIAVKFPMTKSLMGNVNLAFPESYEGNKNDLVVYLDILAGGKPLLHQHYPIH